MSINLYEPFTHPVTGETFRCISFNSDSYKMEWTVAPKGYVPFEHIHYYQDEVFYVRNGQLRLIVDGIEHLLKPGDKYTVPMGSRHIADNYGGDVLLCEVEYKPGLDHYTFFQCFVGLNKDGEYDKKGQMSVPKMAYFMYKTKCRALARPTAIPKPMFNFVIVFFGLVGGIAGWGKQLDRYVGR